MTRLVAEGDELWRPPPDRIAASNLARFRAWLQAQRGLSFGEYEALWRWSVSEPEAFWTAIWEHFDVQASGAFRRATSEAPMRVVRWFEGARVNYAEHVLRHETLLGDAPALRHSSEDRPLQALSWSELGAQVRSLATALRALGLRPGDRVVAYMPNVPETVIALLATAAVGAVWASAAPEFGAAAVVDRFGQIAPKVAFVSDGYVFAGRRFDRRADILDIVAGLPSLEHVVWCPNLGLPPPELARVAVTPYAQLAAEPAPDRDGFVFERVGCDHPLWVLFSSGTTGRPKAIAHSHVGIVVEHLKYMHLHLDLRAGDAMFFYTTTGWMVWNSVVSAMMAGATAILYDGSPVAGGAERLWRVADEAGATLFGASPTLVQQMQQEGVKPRDLFCLERLRSVILSGSPAAPSTFAWFYSDVGQDLWVTSQSGGTELCSGLVGGVVERPVYAGEIQGRMLGMDVRAWNDAGHDLTDEIGELVVARPFPSMPLCFWGDTDGSRYEQAYFSTFPGVWRHGDLIRINARGGCFIPGRSDATLNRYGVRIGAAEVYGVLQRFDAVADALVVCAERPGGGYFMPLFVVPADGRQLDDELVDQIREGLRRHASPRHVPDEIFAVPSVPYTLTGKKMEVPVRRILMGADPAAVASPDAMADPTSLDWFCGFARRPEIAALFRDGESSDLTKAGSVHV